MNEPDWAKVLSYLYKENEEIRVVFSNGEGPHELHEELKISGEIHEILESLHKFGMVSEKREYDTAHDISVGRPPTEATYTLTTKGFDIAHERELNRDQQRTNIGVAILTVFLVIGSLLQGYSAYLDQDASGQIVLLVVIVIGVIIGILVFSFMTGGSWRKFSKKKSQD